MDSRAKTNVQDNDGNNELHRAASNGNLNIVKILLNNDKQLKSSKNKKGQIPLDLIDDTNLELKSLLILN